MNSTLFNRSVEMLRYNSDGVRDPNYPTGVDYIYVGAYEGTDNSLDNILDMLIDDSFIDGGFDVGLEEKHVEDTGSGECVGGLIVDRSHVHLYGGVVDTGGKDACSGDEDSCMVVESNDYLVMSDDDARIVVKKPKLFSNIVGGKQCSDSNNVKLEKYAVARVYTKLYKNSRQ